MSRRTISPLIGAVIFLGVYLAVSPIADALSVGELPLPGAPAADVHAYLAANTLPSLLTGILQGVSGLGLALIVAGPLTCVAGPTASRWRIVGRIALVIAGISLARGRTVFAAPASGTMVR